MADPDHEAPRAGKATLVLNASGRKWLNKLRRATKWSDDDICNAAMAIVLPTIIKQKKLLEKKEREAGQN